jgi:hypothetical protein
MSWNYKLVMIFQNEVEGLKHIKINWSLEIVFMQWACTTQWILQCNMWPILYIVQNINIAIHLVANNLTF